MQDFAAERVDHAYSAIEYCSHDRLIHATVFDQFADEYALIDQRDVEVAGDKLPVAILHLARVGDNTLQALRFEIICEHHEFGIARYLAPVENGNARRFTAVPAPLFVGVRQGVEHAVARRKHSNLIVAPELAHPRPAVKHLPSSLTARPPSTFLNLVPGQS